MLALSGLLYQNCGGIHVAPVADGSSAGAGPGGSHLPGGPGSVDDPIENLSPDYNDPENFRILALTSPSPQTNQLTLHLLSQSQSNPVQSLTITTSTLVASATNMLVLKTPNPNIKRIAIHLNIPGTIFIAELNKTTSQLQHIMTIDLEEGLPIRDMFFQRTEDCNNDGYSDFYISEQISSPTNSYYDLICISGNNFSEISKKRLGDDYYAEGNEHSFVSIRTALPDMNLDGKIDFLITRRINSTLTASILDVHSNEILLDLGPTNSVLPIVTGDLNSDGTSDIYDIAADKIDFYISNSEEIQHIEVPGIFSAMYHSSGVPLVDGYYTQTTNFEFIKKDQFGIPSDLQFLEIQGISETQNSKNITPTKVQQITGYGGSNLIVSPQIRLPDLNNNDTNELLVTIFSGAYLIDPNTESLIRSFNLGITSMSKFMLISYD